MWSEKNKLEAVLDLVRKYPKGPEGKYRRKHYVLKYDWHWLYQRYTMIPILDLDDENRQFYGYDPTELFSLFIKDEFDARDILVSAYKELDPENLPENPSTLWRRARALWFRLRNASVYVQTHGGKGIYSVTWDTALRQNRMYAFVSADSASDAQAIGDTLKGTYGVTPNTPTRVNYYVNDAPAATLALNTKMADKLKKQAQEKVESMKEKLQEAIDQSKRIDMVASMIYHNAVTLAEG